VSGRASAIQGRLDSGVRATTVNGAAAMLAESGRAALLPASMLALLPAAMLVATGAPRVKIGAALPPLLTAGRSPAGHCRLAGRWPAVLAAAAVDGIGRHLRWPAAPRTFRTPVSLARGRTHP
jgi:hypothetical protein